MFCVIANRGFKSMPLRFKIPYFAITQYAAIARSTHFSAMFNKPPLDVYSARFALLLLGSDLKYLLRTNPASALRY